MGPIDYTSQLANPFQSAAQGLQLGAGIQSMQASQQEAQIKAQQQQAALERAQQVEQMRQRFFANPNPTMRDAAELASVVGKDAAAAMQPYLEGMSKQQQQGVLRFNSEVLSALETNPKVAVGLLRQRAAAERNQGDEEEASTYERLAESAERDGPQVAFKGLSTMIAAMPGAKEMFEAAGKSSETQRAQELQPFAVSRAEAEAQIKATEARFAEQLQQAGLNEKNWNVRNLQSQISTRAQQLNIDRQKMEADVAARMAEVTKNLNDIPADTRKLINEAAVSASASKQSADQFNDLARRLASEGGGYGAASTFAEWAKKTTGTQGAVSQMRQEYTRLRNQAAIKSLPPGPATNQDIELAMKGFPPETADAKTVSEFLRGMAKLQDIEAAVNNAKTDWLAQNNGTLTRAKGTFIAGDYSTKPGETFNDFSSRIVKDMAKRYETPKSSDLVNQIPTDRNPNPAAQPNSVRAQADAILRGGR